MIKNQFIFFQALNEIDSTTEIYVLANFKEENITLRNYLFYEVLSGIRKNIVVEPLLNQTYIQRNTIYIQRISSICLNKPVYSK